MSVANIITDIIIKKLEQGEIPWFKPWKTGQAVNHITGRPYSGINRLLLDKGEYLTFKQVQDLGGKIKKGSKSSIVVFYKSYDVEDEETEDELKTVRVLRYYRVFSLSDIEGIEPKWTELMDNKEIATCESVIDEYVAKSGIKFESTFSDRAYYSPSDDMVNVPLINQFESSEHYYSTVFHELAHSTGHKSRLDRLDKTAHFGNEEYSREELVAEITSAMLCDYTGINSSELLDNSTAYIQSWLKALKNDKHMVLYAGAKAEQAYNMITG